jgi:LPXTG-site transpeptidase (sortase) family protein
MRRRSTLCLGAGGLILLVGAVVTLEPWFEALRWQNSPLAAQAQRNAAAPQVVRPRPTDALATQVPVVRGAAATALPARATPTPGEAYGEGLTRAPTVLAPTPTLRAPELQLNEEPTPTLGPSVLQLKDVAFQFQDPPQPGANVLLSVAIHNPTDAPAGPVSLDLPLSWLSGYAIRGIDPLPVDNSVNGQRIGSNLRFTLDGPAAGSDRQVEVYLATTDEVVDAPQVRVVDAEGREFGHALPPTEAPPAEPGPVYAIDIPRLHLHTGVIQVDWEPPLFVVGQLRASAYVTEGNSVLVGHLRGAAGYNVFDHLDELTVGDQIIATSRGQTYEFVISQTQVLLEEDMSPTQPTGTPRLTLMTCAGDWNPLTQDYPERLWVVAEPIDGANARTIREAQR